jgi:hypothetical protein
MFTPKRRLRTSAGFQKQFILYKTQTELDIAQFKQLIKTPDYFGRNPSFDYLKRG